MLHLHNMLHLHHHFSQLTLPIPDDMEIEILAEEEDVDFLEEFSLEEMSVSQVTVMLCDF